jgi:hypothetical protein
MPTTINRAAVAAVAAATLMAFLLAGASRAEASTIFACVKKHTGTTRIVSKTTRCKKGETKLSWNSQGLAGQRGANGSQGAPGSPGTPGLEGREGPQGPGAKSFTATLPEGIIAGPLIKLSNGVEVLGTCLSGFIQLEVETPHENNFEASGTDNNGPTVLPVDAINLEGISVSSKTAVDYDIIAADTTIGKFARIDVHGAVGSPCTFWGMITPTS